MTHRFIRPQFFAGLALVATVLIAPQFYALEKQPEQPCVKAEINAEGLAVLLRAKTPIALMDARGPQPEFIPTAKPCAPDAPADMLVRLVRDKHALIVTYCGGPSCAASQDLADRLARDGYLNVIRYTGGVEEWTKAGFKLTQATPPPKDPPPAGSGSRRSGSRGPGSR